jgi:ferric-dicitrate binding protein FerR (iron transport regulator)
MSDVNRSSSSSGEADWDAIARAMADDSAPEEREALRSHLADHPERAELVEALDGATRRMAADAHAGVDVEAALASVMARRDVAAADTPAIPFRARKAAPARRWTMPALSAAAMLLLALGASLVWRSTTRAPEARYATAAGALRDVRLADGTRVKLGGSSVLTVAAGYGGAGARGGGAGRRVLRGGARRPASLRGAHPRRPRARPGDGVHGARGQRGGHRVVVTQGVVTLGCPAAGRTRSAPAIADAPRGGGCGWSAAPLPATTWRGRAGRSSSATCRSPRPAAELRRWYGVTVVVDDPALARRRINAAFDRGQSVDDVLRVLAATTGGAVQRRDGRLFITRAGP